MLALSFPIPPLIPRPALSWSVEGLHPETPKILRYCAHELGARLCGIEMNLNKIAKVNEWRMRSHDNLYRSHMSHDHSQNIGAPRPRSLVALSAPPLSLSLSPTDTDRAVCAPIAAAPPFHPPRALGAAPCRCRVLLGHPTLERHAEPRVRVCNEHSALAS